MNIFLLTTALLTLASARVAPHRVEDHNISAATGGDGVTPAAPFAPLPYPPASDAVWTTCKCRGENFWTAMHASSEEAGGLFKPPRGSAESGFTDTGRAFYFLL